MKFVPKLFRLSLVGLLASHLPAAEPEVIDCHVHLWDLTRPAGLSWIKKHDSVLYRNMLPADFEKVAKANGVTGVVLVQAGQSLPDNQWNLDITAHNPALFRGLVGNLSEVMGTDAFAPLFDKLSKHPRYLGYRISGRYQEGLSDALYRDLKRTAAAGKSVDFLAGGFSLSEIAVIAQKVPDLRIIVNHFGSVRLSGQALDAAWVKEFRAVAQQPNVYCKVSALYGRFEKQPAPKELSAYEPVLDLAFECFGEDRLVYGSDWPVTEATGDYASVLALMRAYVDKKGKVVSEKLFYRNAEKFYAIPAAK
jgi:L-fuconolactonase